MNKKECLIEGYKIAKNYRQNADIKLAEVLSTVEEVKVSSNLCEGCEYGSHVCLKSILPTTLKKSIGLSSIVYSCDGYQKR